MKIEKMKIGFIAMSGVRPFSDELTALGMTLPGFVERGKVIASLPSLSLLTLAALTPDKYEVDYKEICTLRQAPSLPDDYDLVAISSFSAKILEAYELADQYQKKGIPVVLGGLHVTSMPEEAKEHCTSVVVGEGEPVWPNLMEDFGRGAMKPYYVSSPAGNFDLKDAPMPRYDLLDPDEYNRITIQTSRGCPWKCEFCASSILLTSKYKVKPVKKVIEEIHAIKKIWPNPFIEFADDNSFVNHRHSKELIRALIPEKIKWFTETDISVADDDELLELMRDSGCKQILIGLESPRKNNMRHLEMQSDFKLKRHDGYKKAISKIQSYGITVNGCFVLGFDGDTPDVFKEVYDFAKESGLYEVQVTLMTAFPGTPLYRRLQKEGRLIKENAWNLCTLFDVNHIPFGMSIDELKNGFHWLVEALYNEKETIARRRNFFRMLRSSPNFAKTVRPRRAIKKATKMGVAQGL